MGPTWAVVFGITDYYHRPQNMGFFKRICDFAIWLLPVPGYESLTQKPLQLFPAIGKPSADPHSGCVNSPQTRNCWIDGFDINTDYESKVPPGVVREYDFTLSNQIIDPDGYLVDGMIINGASISFVSFSIVNDRVLTNS